MRLALGAGRLRLVRQLLVENLVLAAWADWSACCWRGGRRALLVTFMSSGRTPIVLELEPDSRILAFTALVAILTGLLCGLVPAFRASRVDIIWRLKGRPGAAAGSPVAAPGRCSSSPRWRCAYCSCSGPACSSAASRRSTVGRRLRAGHVLVVRVEPRGSDQRGSPGTRRLDRAYRELLERLRPSPASAPPAWRTTRPRPGRLCGPGAAAGGATARSQMMVYPSYFATMGWRSRRAGLLERAT